MRTMLVDIILDLEKEGLISSGKNGFVVISTPLAFKTKNCHDLGF